MRVRVIPEGRHERMAFECDVDDAALDAAAAPVNDSQLTKTGFVRSAHVLLDDRGDLGGKKRVQIQLGTDRMTMDHAHGLV